MNIPLPLSQLPLPLSRFLPLSRRRPGLARFSLPATTSPARPPLLSAISSSRPCHSVAAAPWWRLTEAPPQPPPSTPPCPLPPPPPSSGARARKERRFVRGCVGGQERFFMHGQAADSNESKSSGRCKFFLTGRSTMMPLF
uniref:Uncharacterized protein n=1 Tax=Oryza glumipatula TaxID=40148 RepID=A0A0E0BLS9_9ORYZ